MLANTPATPPRQQQERKRRRVTQACISCRTRKSRCTGQRPKCSTCSELGLTCQYVTPGQADQTIVVGKEHFQAIEDRLNHLESLLDEGANNGQSSKSSWNAPDTAENEDHHSNAPNLTSISDDPITGSLASDDPTDGMGHFVFADEEDRAYFGASSNIAFTSDLSRTLKRMSRSGNWASPGYQQTRLPDFHIARVSRPSSPMPCAAQWLTDAHQGIASTSSIFYLPPDQETSILIDQYFANTGLLFPYLHEETFRETYAQLKHDNAATRRTWLGVLNMVLAMATHATVLQVGQAERKRQSEAFYRRANGLCAEHMMNGASVEIVQFLLLVSQYMQGTRSSIQTWATHGLAVKVAFQLGLHSAEASKRFSAVEREIRKRTWFGCIILDRSLSMTFGRPASIPEHYSRLELPIYFDTIESRERQVEARQRCRYSTDFFNATIRLYSILGKVIDLLYDGNLGSEAKIPNYELMTRMLRMRHFLDEWSEQLPKYMGIIQAQNYISGLSNDPAIDRFRAILTLRYHNIRLLIHRVVLVRLCDSLGDFDAPNQDILALQDVAWSTLQIATESASEIINIVLAVVESDWVRRGLLGAWWFTLYYTFDAALVLFTIFLLVKRSAFLNPCPPCTTPELLKQTFVSCIEPLRRLDEGNRTIDKCCWCLQRLTEAWDIIEISNDRSILQNSTLLTQLNDHYRKHDSSLSVEQVVNQDLSFLDFNFMANELIDVTDGFIQA